MKPSLYDDLDFFNAYSGMARSRAGLAAAGEWHQLEPLIPDIAGKRVLDLGCGYGWHCEYAAWHGAAFVLGIDSSARMLEKAGAEHAHPVITYRHCALEDYDYPQEEYDLVLSNLALHYVEDLETVYRQVFRTLRSGGVFLFNIEHPGFTSGVNEDWIYAEDGTPLYWPMDDYYRPGLRETQFLGHRVPKYHHTLTQILDPLPRREFRIENVQEAQPPREMLDLPGMKDELRRPMMLLVRARKEGARDER